MRNLLLIARREFVERGKTGAYLISTFFIMLTLIASTVAPAYFASNEKTKPLNVILIDRTGKVAGPLQELLAAQAKAAPEAPGVKVRVETGEEKAYMAEAQSGSSSLLVIEGTYPTDLKARYLSGNMGMLGNAGAILAPLETLVRGARLQHRGIDPTVAGEVLKPMTFETKHLSAQSGERDQKKVQQSAMTVLGFVMLIYMVLIMNGSFVFQGVLEEKISRVIEVVASTVKPSAMLAGKILGLGGLSLVQFLGMGLAWLAGTLLAAEITGLPPEPPSAKVLSLALLFLVLGYILYASLMAGAASTLSRMEDSQTLLMPLTMVIALPMFFLPQVMNDPDGSTAVALSLIPFFTPIIMLVRVVMGNVPTWQLGLAIALLVVTTYGCIRLGARVYRAAMLVHGSRPSVRQLWQYLRAG